MTYHPDDLRAIAREHWIRGAFGGRSLRAIERDYRIHGHRLYRWVRDPGALSLDTLQGLAASLGLDWREMAER